MNGSYGWELVIGIVLVVVLVAVAGVNTYTNLAPQLSQSTTGALQSGLLTMVLVLVVGTAFVVVALGRERAAAVDSLAEKARRVETGEFDVDLSTNRTDQVGDIYRALAVLRDARELDRNGPDTDRMVSDYCRTASNIADGDTSQRFEEDVDDPQMAELAMRLNEILDEQEHDVDARSST
jgi:methyl-accepting chemotaxis protein